MIHFQLIMTIEVLFLGRVENFNQT